MRAISLFSGAGGFEIGFERAGIQTVLQAESDPWCRQVLERHWPDVERVTDVRAVGRGLSERRTAIFDRHFAGEGSRWESGGLRSPDLIYGGFPCQDLSVAGKRAGFRGERSSLWFEFYRVLSELRPRWTVVENVPGLLSSHGGADFGVLLRGLGDLGYGWAYRVLDARFFGVPQRRRRVFVAGCLGDEARAATVLAVCESCGGHPAPRQEAGEGLAYSLSASVRGTGDGHGNAWNTTYLAASLSAGGHPGSNMPGRHKEDDVNLVVARGLTARQERLAGDADNFVVASGVRRLTPLECERLMSWPDEWTRWTADGREIPDSHRYRLCGNGVVSTVAEYIGHRLVAVDSMRDAHAERCSNG